MRKPPPVNLAAVEADDELLGVLSADGRIPEGADSELARELSELREAVRTGEDEVRLCAGVTGAATPEKDHHQDGRIRDRLPPGWAVWVVLIVILVIAFITGCEPGAEPRRTRPTTEPTISTVLPPVASVTEVIPRYDPAHFGGTRWATVPDSPAGTACTIRGLVMYSEAVATGTPEDGDGDRCNDDGVFRDYYTGKMVSPPTDDDEVDHVFAQADAWRMGAWRWTPGNRWEFRNDRGNLHATTGAVNGGEKSDKGPDEWRPEDRAGWCRYAQTYQGTAERWGLTITPARQTALAEMLATCSQHLP